MMTKEVGVSCSPLQTIFIWECEHCHRRWSDDNRVDCPFCTSHDRVARWDDLGSQKPNR